MNRMSLNEKCRGLVLIGLVMAAVLLSCIPDSIYAAEPFSMKDQKAFIAGDSIQNKSQYKKYGAFIQRTCEQLGATTIYNKAKSGASLANKNNRLAPSVYKQVTTNLNLIKKCRYVFISAGANDYGGFNRGFSKTTKMSKDLDVVLQKIHGANPDAKIIVLTPLYRYKYNNKRVDCDKVKNKIDKKTLKQYRTAIRKVATKKKYKKYVMVVEGTSLISKKRMKSLTLTWDCLHPTAKTAQKYIVPALIKQLNKKTAWLTEGLEPEPEPTPTPTPTPDPEPTPTPDPEPDGMELQNEDSDESIEDFDEDELADPKYAELIEELA